MDPNLSKAESWMPVIVVFLALLWPWLIVWSKITKKLRTPFKGPVMVVTLITVGKKGIHEIMDIKMSTEEQRLASIVILTASGKLAKVDGPIRWSVVEGNSVRLLPSPFGTKCKIIPTGTEEGFAMVAIYADADLGEGVEEITGSIEINVGAPRAATLEPSVGDPLPLEADPQPPED